MRTTVKARNLELSDHLRGQIDRKLRRLNRITHPDAAADVELISNASRANDVSHVAEVTIVNDGEVVRSTASGASPIAALDAVLDKLERQVVRLKEKPRDSRLRDADELEAVLAREGAGSVDGAAADDGSDRPSVVKVKRFAIEPMFEEDAIARMEELGHEFFVFRDAESDAIGVLYRRTDGNYGLIEPADEGRGKRR